MNNKKEILKLNGNIIKILIEFIEFIKFDLYKFNENINDEILNDLFEEFLLYKDCYEEKIKL